MKKFLLIFVVLIAVLVAVFWYANSELQSFLSAGLTNETVIRNANDAAGRDEDIDGWKFAVIGDTEGASVATQQMVDDIATRNIAFVAHLGDLADAPPVREEMEEVMALFDELEVPTHYIIGNNDLVYDEVTERKDRDLYHEVVREDDYYAIIHENAHLLFLDNSYRRDGFPDEELAWLEEQLETEQPRFVGDGEAGGGSSPYRTFNQPYTFLFYHRPISVPGESLFGDDETSNSRKQNAKFRTLLQEYNITRIFNGHLHTTFNYTMDGIPVTVTGGGGAEPQSIFASTDTAFFHYYIVTVPYDTSKEPLLDLVSFE